MRILCTFNNQKYGELLSSYLQDQGIENQLEITSNTDWGSPDYGNSSAKIWVVEEDEYERAFTILKDFEKDPHNLRYLPKEKDIAVLLEPIQNMQEPPPSKKSQIQIPGSKQTFGGSLTIYLILLCSVFLFISTLTSPAYVHDIPQNISYTALYSSPLYKALMYDYPQAFEWLDKFVKAYGIEGLLKLDTVPPEGIKLLNKYSSTPYWKGIYQPLLQHFQNSNQPWNFNAPLFEKIRQGEIWRTFTPALLHYDIFHLFFNMIWLLVLGRQMESKLGAWRYIFFILITGVLSNTAQYLVGGFSFLGFSGILCSMLTFIWIRQKKAAWEGYFLQPSTFGFMAIFIFLMFGIQIGSFFLEAYTGTSIPSGIANTAHLTGGVLGLILGKLDFFSIKNR